MKKGCHPKLERMKIENHVQKSFRDLKIVHASHDKPYENQLLQFTLFKVHVVAFTKYLPQILWLNILLTSLTHASMAF